MILIVASGVNPDIPGGFDRNHHPKDKIVIPNDNFGINGLLGAQSLFTISSSCGNFEGQ